MLQPGEEYFTSDPGPGWQFVRQGPQGGHVYRHESGAVPAEKLKSFQNGIDAGDWAAIHYGDDWAATLTPEQKKSVQNYVTSSDRINMALRGATDDQGAKDAAARYVPNIDAVINSKPLPESVTTWRGVKARDGRDWKALVGTEFSDNGYFSTSINPRESTAHADPAEYSGGAMIRVNLPKGQKAAYLGDWTSEQEMLLPRGMTFKVKAVHEPGTPGNPFAGKKKYLVVDLEIVPASANINLSLDREQNRILDAILSHGTRAGLVVADEFRRRVLALTRKRLPFFEIVQRVRVLLARYEPLFSRALSDSLLASWIAGATEIDREPQGNFLPPPDVPDAPIAASGEGEPIIRFPVIEKAAKDLLERRVMTANEFANLAQDAKRSAFTVSRIASLDTLDRIRQTLARDVKDGGTLREFREQVEGILDETPLAPHHVENLYRTNTAQAYTAGLMDTLRDPLVQDEYPYLLYSATHDARTRPDHLAMESLGLDGTAVYRADDPIWCTYLPPWDYQCRCVIVPINTETAASYGVKEAQQWLATGIPPARLAWVPMPPFRPSEGWMRRQAQTVRMGWIADPNWSDPTGHKRQAWHDQQTHEVRYQISQPGTERPQQPVQAQQPQQSPQQAPQQSAPAQPQQAPQQSAPAQAPQQAQPQPFKPAEFDIQPLNRQAAIAQHVSGLPIGEIAQDPAKLQAAHQALASAGVQMTKNDLWEMANLAHQKQDPDHAQLLPLLRSVFIKNQPNPVLKAVQAETIPADLTTGEKIAQQQYSKGGDTAMNGQLRKGRDVPEDYAKIHDRLQTAFAKAKVLPHPVHVVRGMDLSKPEDAETLNSLLHAALAAKETGEPLQLAGYTSTATGNKIDPNFRGNVEMRIAAVHGLDMMPVSHFPHEKELLLNHNSQFKVSKVERTKKGKYILHLEQLPPAQRSEKAQTQRQHAGKATPEVQPQKLTFLGKIREVIGLSLEREPMPEPEEDRSKRFIDQSAEHVQIGPKTAEAIKKKKSIEELNAQIPLAADETE